MTEAIIGFLSGILSGMGVGGGMLLIPAMRIFTGLGQQAAQSVNLWCFIPSALCAIFVHLKNKKIEIKTALCVILTGVPFSLLGAYASTNISGEILSKLFGGFILIFGIREVVLGTKSTSG